MALIGMSVIGYYKGSKKPEDKDVDVQNAVSTVSTMLSPVLIPMLEAMADLTLNDTT